MSTTIPNPPTFTAPKNNQTFPEGTAQVMLAWTSVPGATSYALRAVDQTEPDLRLPENNCKDTAGNLLDLHYLCVDKLSTTSYSMRVRPGHSYHCWVHAVNSAGYSQPAFVDFRVLVTDAAEFVFQNDQLTQLPGETFYLFVVMRNAGSTTWTTPAGYRLGSQNPQDNMRWGANRVDLPANTQVPPGATVTFFRPLQAPTTAGVYDLQWQMVHDGVRWFGEPTRNVRITVRAAPPAAGKLTRNLSNGRILADGVPVTLRGGHYDLFQQDSQCARNFIPASGALPFIVAYKEGVDPCNPSGPPAVAQSQWKGTVNGNNWSDLFTCLRRTNANLLRVWLSTGTRVENGVPTDLMPFQMNSAGKYLVREAVEQNQWHTPFFDRLSTFARLAEQNGVYLQISLFNYWDLTDDPDNPNAKTWSKSFWNPIMCSDGWYGQNNLVNAATYLCADGEPPKDQDKLAARRQCFFVHPPAGSGLPNVQSMFIRRVVQALTGRKNIILELMNEPHRGTPEEIARFYSRIVGDILLHAGAWRPLISVNSFRFQPDGNGEMEWWKADSVSGKTAPNYGEVDILSYHGLTGYAFKENVCGARADVLGVDPAHIRQRLTAHGRWHPAKAIMFSTDSVRVGPLSRTYIVNGNEEELILRDGQIVTKYLEYYPRPEVRSDLSDWAYWCFREGAAIPGYVHFQNHSHYDLAFCHIAAAWQKVNPS